VLAVHLGRPAHVKNNVAVEPVVRAERLLAYPHAADFAEGVQVGEPVLENGAGARERGCEIDACRGQSPGVVGPRK